MNDADNASRLLACKDGWTYLETEDYGQTIVTQWDLVCQSSYQVELSQMFSILGMGLGFLLISPQSDRFGRKPVHYLALGLGSVSFLMTSFSYHYMMFFALRFMTGFAVSGTASGFTAGVEMFPSKYRGDAGILVQVAWMVSMLFLDLLAYYIRDWKTLVMVLGGIPLLLMPTYFYVSESVPWLIKKGRIREASDVVSRAAKINRLDVVPNLQDFKDEEADDDQYWEERSVHEGEETRCRNNFMMMIRNKTLRKHCIIMILIWFNCAFVYYGISYTSVTWSGDRFLNFLYNSLAEAPAIVFVLILLRRMERRTLICWCFILGGLVLLAATFIPHDDDNQSLNTLKIVLIITGKILACSAFNTAYLYTQELFPTSVRNTGVGVCIMGSVMGSLVTAFSPLLGRLYPSAPGILFAVLPLLVGPLALFLPETKNRPLAQSMKEMEEWDSGPGLWSRCRERVELFQSNDSVFLRTDHAGTARHKSQEREMPRQKSDHVQISEEREMMLRQKSDHVELAKEREMEPLRNGEQHCSTSDQDSED